MTTLRLVLDTNIVVSAAVRPDGLQWTLFRLAMTKPLHWYVSGAILREYEDTLSRPILAIPRGIKRRLLDLIRQRTRLITPVSLPTLTSDPDDNIFLECADAARADYLVTGNQRHFPKFWKNTKIIGTRSFLEIVAPHLLA